MESNLNRELVAVLFPGLVKNEEKAIECLGGIRNISQVYSNATKKRLGLSYQPENPFIKKIYSDITKVAGVVLKVRVKKRIVDNVLKREVIATTILGHVKKIYRFESMCDFQYLPVHKEGAGEGSPQCILEQILPTGTTNLNFITETAPLFIVPWNFTRFDKPITYSYTDKKYMPERKDTVPENDDDIHSRRRSDRAVPPTRIFFNLIDDLPTEPHEYYIKQKNEKIAMYPGYQQEFDTIKKLFEERPIWSQNLIKYLTKIRLASLKIMIPCLAIYMRDGPWRAMWVKYGYDPRKEPGARIYQTLDFRMRHQAGVRSMVMTRDHIVHYKKTDRVRNISKCREDTFPAEVVEAAVYFRPGMVPSQRQIFYQYCDVKLPEVEELVGAELPAGSLCHEKRGWLPPNAAEICRDHMFRYVKQTLLATHNADIKFDQDSSDESSNSDEDQIGTSSNK